ncbi:MAG: PQQ-binding-like beta-propeller repeat protein [Gemmatimonadaceae bacterium]
MLAAATGPPHSEVRPTRASGARWLGALGFVLCTGGTCDEPVSPPGGGAQLLWSHAEKGAAAQPYVDDELAIFTTFDESRVVTLDARTGAVRWKRQLPLPAGIPTSNLPSANVIAFEDLVIVPAWDLYALDRGTGAVRWVFQPPDDFPGAGEVTVSGGRVYATGRLLYALDAESGALLWRTDLGEQPFYPVVMDGVIYLTTRGAVEPGSNVLGAGHAVALDAATGEVVWRFGMPDVSSSRRGGSVGPPFVKGELVLVAGASGRVYALDRRSGTSRWEGVGSGPYFAGLAVVDQTVIVAGDVGSVEGFDLATGALRWQTRPGSSVSNTITLGNDVALVAAGTITAYEASGRMRWQHGGAGFGGPVYNTTPTYHNGVVYAGSSAGFHAVRPPR